MVGSSESSQPWCRQAAILQPVCQGHTRHALPFSVPWQLLQLLQAIPLSGKWWLCSSGSPSGGSPCPIAGTSLCPKPPRHGPSTASRSAERETAPIR